MDQNNEPLISIIIPTNGKRERSLQRCFDSIKERTKLPFEVFIERGGDCVSWAINNGLRKARGKYLTIPNIADDIEVLEGWDFLMVDYLDKRPQVGAGVFQILKPNMDLESYGGFVLPERYNLDPDVYPDYGGYMLVKREVFEKVGFMDENFKPIYCEDADYGLRIWEAGYKVGVCMDAKIIHHHEQSGRRNVKEENREYLLEKHKKWLTSLL